MNHIITPETCPDFTFDESEDPETGKRKHLYRYEGKPVPSITMIMSQTGVTDLWKIPKDRLQRAAARGTAVHMACELLDRDNLDEGSLDPEIVPYVQGYRRFISEYQPKWDTIEVPFYSPYGYAGKLDRAGTITSGDRIIMDIKTSEKISGDVGVQLAAQAILLIPSNPTKAKRYSLQLTKEGRFHLLQHDSLYDFEVWYAALTVFLGCRLTDWRKMVEKGKVEKDETAEDWSWL